MHRARQDVRADLAAFLEDADRNLAPGLGGELLQADRRAQPGRTCADDHDVIMPWIRVRSSFLSSRCQARSARDMPCLFLDRAVNAERIATWVGSTTV